MKLDVAIQLKAPEWKKLLRPYGKTTRDMCMATLSETALAKKKASFEMTVVLADDAFIRELNRDYRGQDKPTNVLSFPNPDFSARNTHIGDIVLAHETLVGEAQAQGKRARDHALHLLAHGTLHLLGYDHMRANDALRMENLEIKILKKQGIANPYL